MIENLCDEVAIIDDGKIIAQGSPKDLIANDGESQINITVDNWDSSLLPNFNSSFQDNIVTIKSKNSDKDTPHIINKITDANISITKLDIRKANLEDVFIKLTGKKLSDD